MKTKKYLVYLVIAMALAFLVGGCSSAAAQEPERVEIPANNINFLIGVWEIEVDGQNFRMEFKTENMMRVGTRAAPAAFASGPYRLEGNRLVDTSMASCDALYDLTIVQEPGAEMPGLHFELVGEDCEASRVEGLDGKTLYPYPPGF